MNKRESGRDRKKTNLPTKGEMGKMSEFVGERGKPKKEGESVIISLSLSSTMTLTRQGSSLLVEDIKDRVEPLNLNSRSTA